MALHGDCWALKCIYQMGDGGKPIEWPVSSMKIPVPAMQETLPSKNVSMKIEFLSFDNFQSILRNTADSRPLSPSESKDYTMCQICPFEWPLFCAMTVGRTSSHHAYVGHVKGHSRCARSMTTGNDAFGYSTNRHLDSWWTKSPGIKRASCARGRRMSTPGSIPDLVSAPRCSQGLLPRLHLPGSGCPPADAPRALTSDSDREVGWKWG